jgi:CheY-like chemotaxis protein
MSEKRLATILLVEDEASDADLICRGFAKAKVVNPIVHLRNGDDALAYLEGVGQYADRAKFPLPAFILLDLKLPGMKGLELLQWKRTRREVRRIPVVVLTSDRESATIDAAYDLGANSYLVKPGNPTEIVRIVETIQRYWIDLNEPPQLVISAKT